MDFDDAWLDDDTEALEHTCLVEVPSVGMQSAADGWGLGTVTTSGTPNYVSCACMEIPERVFIDRVDGVTKAVSIGLIIDDEDGDVVEARRIQYNSKRYQVTQILEPRQHNLKRVLLAEINQGN